MEFVSIYQFDFQSQINVGIKENRYIIKSLPLFELAGKTIGGDGFVVIELPVKSTHSISITFLKSRKILSDNN